MGRPNDIHLFDFDGRSVLERQQLAAENEKLRAEVERLRRVITMMKRQAEAPETAAAIGLRH